MKRTEPYARDKLALWLRTYHGDHIDELLKRHTKDAAAKLLREHLHERGITHGDGVNLSRGQLRQALTRFERHGPVQRVP